MSKLIVYGAAYSPPCRAVFMTAKGLGLTIKIKELDLFVKNEHRESWFLKLNPNHTIPTLDDNGFHLWESRAIMSYLVTKYGKNDHLYPKEPEKRALVDNMMYFDLGSLYQAICDYYFAPMFEGSPINPKKLETLKEKLSALDTLLASRGPYVTGENLTIADFSIVQSVATLELLCKDLKKFTNILKWFKKLKSELPYYEEIMTEGVNYIKGYIKDEFK